MELEAMPEAPLSRVESGNVEAEKDKIKFSVPEKQPIAELAEGNPTGNVYIRKYRS
jgi:hypothetical protein